MCFNFYVYHFPLTLRVSNSRFIVPVLRVSFEHIITVIQNSLSDASLPSLFCSLLSVNCSPFICVGLTISD